MNSTMNHAATITDLQPKICSWKRSCSFITCMSQSLTHWPCSRSWISLCCLPRGTQTSCMANIIQPEASWKHFTWPAGWRDWLCKCQKLPKGRERKKKQQSSSASLWKKEGKKIPGKSTLFTGAATWPTAPKSPKQPISVCSQRERRAVSLHPCCALTVDPLKVYQLNALPTAAVQLVFCGE